MSGLSGTTNEDAYRCTGCGGWFHKECILKHFELEKEHDYGRQQERKQIKKELQIWLKKGTEDIEDFIERL